ncbi:MAG: hypothetical protein IPP51_00645 [Bacteroidetes bacterium]|nr:hypothetical protein [Bacteroidota bacterium]
MKRILFSFALLLICLSKISAQHGQIIFNQMDIVDITSFGRDTIVAVGGSLLNPVSGWPENSCFIIRSTDGGNSWAYTYRGQSQAQFHKLCALSDSKGFAVSDSGLLYSTIDAGATWKKEVLPYNYNLYNIEFTDTSTGYMTGSEEKYWKTTDGGESWVLHSVGGSFNGLYDIEWVNDTTGFLCGEKSYRTTNGGTSWSTSSFGNFGFRIREHWNSPTDGWESTGSRTGYSTNGGTSFSIDSSFGVIDYHAFTNSHLIGISDTSIYETSDGGNTWNQIGTLPQDFSGKCIHFTNTLVGYAGGVNAIMKTTDGGQTWAYTNYNTEPGINDVIPVDTNVIYANSYFSMHYTTDGGYTWRIRSINSIGSINRMRFFDPANGIAATTTGLYNTSDSGATWTLISSKILSDVNAFNPTNLFGYDDNNYFAYSIDGGATWSTNSTNNSSTKTLVLSPTVGFAIISNDLYRTIDGGLTWTNMLTTGILILRWDMADSLNGVAEEIVNGNLFITTDGGHTWTARAPSPVINSMTMVAPNELYIATTSTQLLSTDSALTFTDLNTGIDPAFTEIVRIPTGGILMFNSSAILMNPQLGLAQCRVISDFNHPWIDMFETDVYTYSNQSSYSSQHDWLVDGSPSATGNNFSFAGTTVGNYSICLDASDGPGCIDRSCTTMEVVPLGSEWLYRAQSFNSIYQHRATFVIGDYAYQCTGEFLSSGSALASKINLITFDSDVAASLPGLPRHSAVGFAINGKGYVGLGFGNGNTYLSDFYEYDPTTDTWTQKANYPGHGNRGASVFVINNKAYVINGCSFDGTAIIYYNECWEYDPATDVWTAKANCPGAGRMYTMATATSTVGVCGGGSIAGFFDDYYKYNPVTDQWTTIPAIPANPFRSNGPTFSHNNIAYFAGGYNTVNNQSTVWGYDDFAGTWGFFKRTSCSTFTRCHVFHSG